MFIKVGGNPFVDLQIDSQGHSLFFFNQLFFLKAHFNGGLQLLPFELQM